jgi:Protein of unknown function (DUF3180)
VTNPPKRPFELKPISVRALSLCGVFGLLVGWLLHRGLDSVIGHAPLVTWSQMLSPFVAAAFLGATAWVTWRQVQHHKLEFQRAVNRLVLARSSAIVAAWVAGGYTGYAISWLGIGTDFARSAALRSGLTLVGGIAMLLTALTLERACRVRSDGPDT